MNKQSQKTTHSQTDRPNRKVYSMDDMPLELLELFVEELQKSIDKSDDSEYK